MTILKCPAIKQFSSVITSGEAKYGIIYKTPETFDRYKELLSNFTSSNIGMAIMEEPNGKNMAATFGVKKLPLMLEYNEEAKTLEVVMSGSISVEKLRELLAGKLTSEIMASKPDLEG